jgi:lipopolysaccharide transport system permease protein
MLLRLTSVPLLPPLHRDIWLLRQLVGRDMTNRHRDSLLGVLGPLVLALLPLLLYTFVFSVVLRVRWSGAEAASSSHTDYALILLTGMIPYLVCGDVLARTPMAVLSSPNYVKKVVFPLYVLPLVVVSSAVLQSLISMALLVLSVLVLRGELHLTQALLPLAYLPLLLISVGLGWLLSSLSVFIRDVANLTPFIGQILLFATPIFYPASAVPPPFSSMLNLNPLTGIVDTFRRIVLWNQMPDWTSFGVTTTGAMLFALVAYHWFQWTSSEFADSL